MEETQAMHPESQQEGTTVPTPPVPPKSDGLDDTQIPNADSQKTTDIVAEQHHQGAELHSSVHPSSPRGGAAIPAGPVEELRLPDSTRTAPDAAEQDPLTRRPRIATIIGSAVCGILFLVLAAACWWLLVRTLSGQQLDNMAFTDYMKDLPFAMLLPARVMEISWVVGQVRLSISVLFDIVFAIFALTLTIVRKRWLLLVQMIVFAIVAIAGAEALKYSLPRTDMDRSLFDAAGNTSPSGHMAAAVTAAVVLLCVVPRVWRAIVAVIGSLYSSCVAISLVSLGYHRPGDVVAALLWVFGLALIMLATTRAHAMDKPGERLASASIQIVASLMITIGVCALAYAGYVIWQLMPGVQFEAMWATWAAHIAMNFVSMALPCLGFGVVLAFRHATASPLSKLGMLGMPPAPPSGGRRK